MRKCSNTWFVVCACACVIMLAVILCVGESMHVHAVSATLEATPTQTEHVVRGQTVWQVAQEHPVTGVSTSELVRWLRELNHLDDACLVPGQELIVPLQLG